MMNFSLLGKTTQERTEGESAIFLLFPILACIYMTHSWPMCDFGNGSRSRQTTKGTMPLRI